MKQEEQAEEINALVNKLVELRKKKAKSAKLKSQYNDLQRLCSEKLEYLIEARARRYKGFSNYDDLCQDGRLALHLALQSYEPDKGDFFWWANKYIKTKISREANRHSTIKIPLKHTKHVQPYKVSQIPVIVDSNPTALDSLSKIQFDLLVRKAVEKLPEDQKMVIELHFEMNDKTDSGSIGNICKRLNIKRANCVKLLDQAKETLREELFNYY